MYYAKVQVSLGKAHVQFSISVIFHVDFIQGRHCLGQTNENWVNSECQLVRGTSRWKSILVKHLFTRMRSLRFCSCAHWDTRIIRWILVQFLYLLHIPEQRVHNLEFSCEWLKHTMKWNKYDRCQQKHHPTHTGPEMCEFFSFPSMILLAWVLLWVNCTPCWSPNHRYLGTWTYTEIVAL